MSDHEVNIKILLDRAIASGALPAAEREPLLEADERIAARNTLAAEVVASQKIPIVDLNAAVRGHPEFHSDNVHFNGQGTQTLAAQVYAAAEKLLPR